jgi:hypothetical protein
MCRLRYQSSEAHHQTNRQVERVNELILQEMETRMFHDMEAKGRNWHKELPSVLWALRTNVNQFTRDSISLGVRDYCSVATRNISRVSSGGVVQ